MYLEKLKELDNFELCSYYIEQKNFEEAYKIAGGPELTMYLLKETGSFHTNPLKHLEYVPEYYLYEIKDEELFVYVGEKNKEIRDNAFAYCSIKKLLISKNVESIGENALSLNEGDIEFEGTKEEFISKFLGKSLYFSRTHRNQQIKCAIGIIDISK